MAHSPTLSWVTDTDLPGFVKTPLNARFYGRDVCATLVRHSHTSPSTASEAERTPLPASPTKAVLYLHGLTDYFFQAHLADAYRDRGYTFYGLDLHAYGRSLTPQDLPNYCATIAEYYPQIDAAIESICATGITELHLNGHSTGGLIAALYAHEGKHRHRLTTLVLNSPFVQMPLPPLARLALSPLAALGRWWPHFSLHQDKPTLYAQSIYCGFYGEWDYNLNYKPLSGFPLYAGWYRAIRKAQKYLQRGLNIQCPILLLHSAHSVKALQWSEQLLRADAVLNIEHMRRYGPGLGARVKLMAIAGAMHDVMLSALPVRQKAMQVLFQWLDNQCPNSPK